MLNHRFHSLHRCLDFRAASRVGDAGVPLSESSAPSVVRLVFLSVALITWQVAVPADAGVVITAEGERHGGELTMPSEAQITLTPEEGEPRTFDLIDLERVLLRPDLSPGQADVLLIDHDGRHAATTESASVKLKAGLHRVTLAYWQGPGPRELKLEYSGPDLPRTEVPGSAMFNVKNEQDPPTSPGYDATGLRIPENPESPRPRLRYRYFTGTEDEAWTAMSVFDQLEEKRSGTTDRVSVRVADQEQYFGVLFTGYLKIDKDGEYTFHLTSDDGSRLWLGTDPPMLRTLGAGGAAPEARPWTVELAGDGRVTGRITAWDEKAVTIQAPLGDEALTLKAPREHVRQLLPRGEKLAAADRVGETPTADHAYVRKDGDDKSLARVSGRAMGIEDQTLLFEYRGELRKIALDRLAGLIFAAADAGPPASDRFAFSQRLDLLPGHVLPGRWAGLEAEQLTFETAWGQRLTIPSLQAAAVRMIGGRLIYLADSEPDDVHLVPYFDRLLPMRRNQGITGQPLALINGQRFARGFAVHGQTHLHFNLAGGFERLMLDAGLASPGGEDGDVTLRVLGDGKPLFEHKHLTAADQPLTIDLDVSGVHQLTLETGFGDGQDVGDRVIWAEPRLIRKR